MFQFTTIAVIIFVTTGINVIVSVIAWRRRKKTRSGAYFALGMIGVTIWTLAAGFDYAAVPIPLKVFFATLEAWGYMAALPLFALVALSFAGYDHWLEKKWVKALFLFVPASNILLVSTNGLHGWVWTDFIQVSGNIVIFEHGPAYQWIVFNGYLTILFIIVILWISIRMGSDITRRQGKLLLGATLFPFAVNLIYNFWGAGTEGVDWTSVTFSVTGLLFLQALSATRFLDLVPIARDKLLNNMSDGMIVLDTQDRVIDINKAAAKVIGTSVETILGKNLTEFAPLTRSFWGQQIEQETHAEVGVDSPEKRYFDALLSPLRDGSQKVIGRLIIFREITERKWFEIERENMIMQLEKRNAESESLRETTSIVTSTLDISEVVEQVLKQIKRVVAYDSASVWLYRGTSAHMVGGDGVPEMPVEDRQYPLSESEPDYPLWVEKIPYVLLDDIQENYAMFREPPINYIRGWMAIPLKVRERLIGFIALDSRQAGYFTEEHAQLVLTYASQVSFALENARLYSNLQDELYQRQELINELDAKKSDIEHRYLEIQELHKNLQETQAQLVDQQRTVATMEERQRLARDLHDSVNQSIYGMVLFTETLAATLEKGNLDRARQIMDRLQESARQSLKEARLMLYELQESGPERSVDLVQALEERLASVESRAGVRTQFILDGSMEHCPLEWRENLFWIAVEALNNALKHAQASSVEIVLRCFPEHLDLEILDNGKGFNMNKIPGGGMGLNNLQKRADIIGGRLNIVSGSGNGTRILFQAQIKRIANDKD